MTLEKIVVQSGLCHFEDLRESAALQYLGRKLPLFEREVHTDIFTFPILHHHLYFVFFSWLYRCLRLYSSWLILSLSFFAFVFVLSTVEPSNVHLSRYFLNLKAAVALAQNE